MSLINLGPLMFGGTTGIIQYFRSVGLHVLAQSKTCGRFKYLNICV